MLELLETIDQLENDLCVVLDELTNTTEDVSTLMNRAGHLDWEIRVRTDALLTLLRKQYTCT